MAGLHFDITGDNSNFLRKLQEAENGVKSTSKQIEESGISVEQMFSRMTKAAAAFGVGFSAQQLISQITKVRGEFQQLEVAFNTMLGSKEQADTLMSQLVRTAAITPFDLQGVANGAKQLLAYGTAAEDVNGTLVRLGDIAAGLSIPLNDLVWLYGTTMTQGRLFTQDLRQFQGRGIPLADELAKQFGVTKDKVGELVTAGKVGFPEVQKAIEAMTNEGGKFGGLMEAQSKTITGQISNIEDAIATMFNQIGKENESTINSALSGVSYLVEHWEAVAVAIESAAIAYGTYKAAVMATAALQGAEQTLKIDTDIEGLKSLLVVKEQSKNADLEAAVASGTLTEAKAVQLASLREELATRLTVLKLKEEEVIAEQASALSAFNSAKKASDAANERLEKMDALYQAALAQGDASYEQYAMEQLQTASANANTAATNLNTAEKNLNAASSKRKAASEAVDTMSTQANTVANHANTASMNIMKLAGIQLTTMLKGMWATLMANPLFLIAGALTGLAFAIYKVATAENEAEKATRMYNEALDEQKKKQEEYKERIDSLIKAIDDNNKSEGERLQAFEALKAEYPTVLNNLLTEAEYLKEIAKYKKLITEEDKKRSKNDDEELLRLAKLKLQKYEISKRRGVVLVDMDGNGWASDNIEDAIKAQLEIVNKAIAKVASHDVTSYLGNIKNLEDSEIISVIDGINTSLKALGKSGDDAIAIVSELGGEFSKSQLSSIKNALETEQKARSGEKNTGRGWIEKYKKEYLDAQKELDDFLNTQSALSEIEYEKKLKELTDKRNEVEKKYKSVGGLTGSSLNKQESAAEKQQEAIRAQNDKLMSMEFKQTLERQRQQQDLENQIAQSTIDALSDGYDKEKAQRDLNNKKEIQSLTRQKEDYIRAYVQAQKEIFNASEELKSKKIKGYTKQTFDSSTVNVDEIIAIWDKIIKNTETQQGVNEWQRREDSMNEYLIEYGTFSQKKEAIDKKYQAAIDKETDLGTKNTLKKKWDEALSALNVDELKQKINWEMIFGDLSKVTKDQLTKIKNQLQEFKKSTEFQNATPEQIQVIENAINSINDAMVDKGGFFGGLSDSLNEYEESVNKVKEAQEELEKALRSGDEAAIEKAQKKKNAAEQNQANAQIVVEKSKDKAINNITAVANAMKQLGSAEFSLSNFGTVVGGLIDALSESGSKIGGIIAAILSLLDEFGKDGGIEFGKNVVENVISAIGGTIEVPFKMLGIDLGLGGADYSGYNKMVDEYENLNKIWDDLIEKKKKYIDISYGEEAIKAGKEAEKLVDQKIERYRTLGKEILNSGASAGSHSIGVRQRDKYISSEGWNEALTSLGSTSYNAIKEGRMEGLFDLSIEQLDKLKNEAPTFWGQLDDDVRGYLNSIIEGGERIGDIQKQVQEQLAATTFDNVYDNFIDTLMDMKSTANDAADDIGEYFFRAMLSNQIGDEYRKKLKVWYEKFALANKDGLDTNEMNDLRDEYQAMMEAAIAQRDSLAAITGYDESSSSQSSTKGFAAMSQDTGEELNGRFTALQIAGEEIKKQMTSAVIGINSLILISSDCNIILKDILNQHVITNSYLEDIAGIQKKIIMFLNDNVKQNLIDIKKGVS